MNITEEILAFASKNERPGWQKDLIRRIYCQSELTDQDRDEVFRMLKAEHGLMPPEKAMQPIPLTEKDIPHIPDDAPPVILNSIGSVAHTNNLATDQTLSFAINGITLIYGDNGSGKSGYCRLLKKICRVRQGGEEEILGNAFAAPDHPPAEATVRLSIDGQAPQPFAWKEGVRLPALSRVSVFDVRTAPIYVGKEYKIDFLPQGLDVLPRLAQECRRLAARLTEEIRVLETKISGQSLPKLPPDTAITQLVNALVIGTAKEDLPAAEKLRTLATWTQDDQKQLDELDEQIRRDPARLSTHFRVMKNQADDMAGDLRRLLSVLGDETCGHLQAACTAAREARYLADEAAKGDFAAEPIPAVGNETWRKMFRYAREFSTTTAFPEKVFPAEGDGSVCVLCQQELQPEAADRLRRFDAFLQNRTAAEAKTKEQAVREHRAGIEQCVIRKTADVTNLLKDIRELNADKAEICAKIVTCYAALTTRKTTLLGAIAKNAFTDIPPLPAYPLDELGELSTELDRQADSYEQQARDPEAQAALRSRQAELQARKALSENIKVIFERHGNLMRLHCLADAKAQCDTDKITRKGSELRKACLEENFKNRLKQEVDRLDLGHLPLKILAKGDTGASLLGVGLDAEMKQVQPVKILSEGEFRALALACFFTDIASIPGNGGIILDDPVSSLHHERQCKVAERLVEEAAKGRQVIIFTHSLTFYQEVKSVANKKRVPLISHAVNRCHQRGCGIVEKDGEPWIAKSVNQRIHELKNRLAGIKKLSDQSGEEYRLAVEGFYGDFRKTCERLVEERLFNNVVQRFDTDVKTLSLHGVKIDDADYLKVYWLVTRSSEWCHDRAKGLQNVMPKPHDIQADLDELETFADALRTRKNRLERERERLLKAPKGQVA